MSRLVIGGFAAVLLAIVGGASSAAPVPKDAGKSDPTPELKVVFDTVGKAVKDEKWPAEVDEKKLRDTARIVFDRTLKAAEQKERKLPADFDKLTKADVAKEYKAATLTGGFVVAGDVRIASAKDSAIFASGDVQITHARNCVIVAQNVRCTVVEDCTVIAGEYIRLNGADKLKDKERCVLVAGQWIRTTTMDGTVCHVLRPGILPSPDEGKFNGNQPHPAIRTNGAKGVIFLNAKEETGANGPQDCTYLPQKNPIAK